MHEQRLLGDPPLLGRTLGERYLLRSLLGRGGMGEVYGAEDLRLHRPVAVKLLREDLASDPRLLARFRREARTAGSLTHPNIVAVHDVGADGDRVYLVMELVRGQTLAEVIRAEAPLAPRRAARIAERVAEALEFAHARGVVHRDVAPGNVMLTHTGEVKVLDFGIARTERHRSIPATSTAPPSVHGTVAYLAPEQASGGPAGRRADIYALGAVLYELLTGAPPRSPDPTVPPGARQAGIPSAIDAAVMRCLAREPGARFARAAEVAAALAAAVGEAPQTRPVPLIPARLDPAPRRGPTTPVLDSAPTLPIASTRGAARARPPAGRWAVASATVLAGLATWFVALPVWHAMSDPPVPQPPATVELQAPTRVTSTGTCDGWWSARVDLAWTPGTTDAAAFEIYRADEGEGSYRLVQRLDGGATRWTDRGLGLGATYSYLVRAVDGTRRSPLTPELEGSTPSLCLG
jgi:eukaryotic-like serine/threonine-protein kinase